MPAAVMLTGHVMSLLMQHLSHLRWLPPLMKVACFFLAVRSSKGKVTARFKAVRGRGMPHNSCQHKPPQCSWRHLHLLPSCTRSKLRPCPQQPSRMQASLSTSIHHPLPPPMACLQLPHHDTGWPGANLPVVVQRLP